MILVAMTTKPHHEDVYYPQVRAYKQTPTADTCFVKVLGKFPFFPFCVSGLDDFVDLFKG